MPSINAHLILGALTGAAVDVGLQFQRMEDAGNGTFAWGELLVCSATAALAATLPDVLEPATSPDHRGFFHSFAMAGLVAYVISQDRARSRPAEQALLLAAAGLGYLSHLAADATTASCLPTI